MGGRTGLINIRKIVSKSRLSKEWVVEVGETARQVMGIEVSGGGRGVNT